MCRTLLTLTAAATVLATGSLVPRHVEALPLSASIGVRLAVEAIAPIENVAFCFYVDGWNGPGLYECGFHRRQGEGWHGPRSGDDRRGRNVDHDDRRGDQSDYRRGDQLDGRGLQTEGRGRR
jgi:hypothetical protein